MDNVPEKIRKIFRKVGISDRELAVFRGLDELDSQTIAVLYRYLDEADKKNPLELHALAKDQIMILQQGGVVAWKNFIHRQRELI